MHSVMSDQYANKNGTGRVLSFQRVLVAVVASLAILCKILLCYSHRKPITRLTEDYSQEIGAACGNRTRFSSLEG